MRYGLFDPGAGYDDIRSFFTANLPQDDGLYNDFPAQIVHPVNAVCESVPACASCPIRAVEKKEGCPACR